MSSNIFTNEGGGVKPWVVWGILALAIVTGSYFIYGAWNGSNELKATLMCSECGNIRTEALAVGEMLPATCSKCGKNAMLPAFHCPSCKTVNIWNENRGLPPPTKCRKCGQEVRHGR